jgi:protein phosphatase 2C family protein 2/3
VSRAFGDIEAKHPRFGGKPGVMTAIPDIRAFTINEDHDFVVLACDGIFDKLSNREIVDSVVSAIIAQKPTTVHEACGVGVNAVLVESVKKQTLDNITVVVIAFEGLRKFVEDCHCDRQEF